MRQRSLNLILVITAVIVLAALPGWLLPLLQSKPAVADGPRAWSPVPTATHLVRTPTLKATATRLPAAATATAAGSGATGLPTERAASGQPASPTAAPSDRPTAAALIAEAAQTANAPEPTASPSPTPAPSPTPTLAPSPTLSPPPTPTRRPTPTPQPTRPPATATPAPATQAPPAPTATTAASPAPVPPTATATRRPPSPTAVPPATAAAVPAATATAMRRGLSVPALVEPLGDLPVNGTVTFRWLPTGPLPAGAMYEVVWWNAGDPPNQAMGIAPPTAGTAIQANLDVLYRAHQIKNNNIYWTVLIVQVQPYLRLTQPAESNPQHMLYSPP